jgi:hypothetical protein
MFVWLHLSKVEQFIKKKRLRNSKECEKIERG